MARRGGATRNRSCVATFANACILLVALGLAGCLPATGGSMGQADLTGKEKIERLDRLRAAEGDYERRMIVREYDTLLRRRQQDQAIQAIPPPAHEFPPLPREWEGPAVDERTLGGIVKERGQASP